MDSEVSGCSCPSGKSEGQDTKLSWLNTLSNGHGPGIDFRVSKAFGIVAHIVKNAISKACSTMTLSFIPALPIHFDHFCVGLTKTDYLADYSEESGPATKATYEQAIF